MLRSRVAGLVSRCFRKRDPVPDNEADQHLQRCLSVIDLTAIGVGSTLGAGIYVVVGQVAKDAAGPAVIVSFLMAAVASVLAGLCYAEFGARVPGAGSCYQYALVSAGELPAFLAGWDMILTYMITSAGVAGTLSDYLDSLTAGRISAAQRQDFPLLQESAIIRPYADLLAGGLTIGMTLLLSCSLRQVAKANSAFTVVNVTVIAYVIICGLFKIRFSNWSLDPGSAPAEARAGSGGFSPFGWSGIIRGAGTCFFAFVGFDTIATAGDEAKQPQRDIPLATVLCLLCCCICYCAVALVLTLMHPYYLLSDSAPLMAAFSSAGWPVAAYIVAGGAVCSLFASMFGTIFPMPRVMFAMAKDGLLCKFCGFTARHCQSPAAATAVSGCCSAVLATFVRVTALVDLASIGTLLAYTLVAICVACDRYAPVPEAQQQSGTDDCSTASSARRSSCNNASSRSSISSSSSSSSSSFYSSSGGGGLSVRLLRFVQRRRKASSATHKAAVSLLLAALLLLGGSAYLLAQPSAAGPLIGSGCLLVLAVLVCGLPLAVLLPQNRRPVAYRVPAVPLLPLLSCGCNLALLFGFPAHALLLFSMWMLAGLVLYCSWGCHNSNIGSSASQHRLLP